MVFQRRYVLGFFPLLEGAGVAAFVWSSVSICGVKDDDQQKGHDGICGQPVFDTDGCLFSHEPFVGSPVPAQKDGGLGWL